MSGDTFNYRMPGGAGSGWARQMLRFAITEGPRAGESLDVPMPEPGEPPVLIGRSRECAIWIDAQNISRRNTEILSGADRMPMIRDMGSVNGTLVNGVAVSQTQPMPLRPGDHIRVGLTELIFSGLTLPQAAPVAPPAAITLSNAPTLGSGLSEQFVATSALTMTGSSRPVTLPGSYFVYLVMRDGQRYQLEGEEITVGRGQSNDIVIDSNSISRQHARLQRSPNGVLVQDAGSTNKTFVNGVQADSPVLLRDGDTVRFGEVEADFKLEKQRVTQSQPLVNRALTGSMNAVMPDAAEVTQPEGSELTFNAVDNSFGTQPNDQTFAGQMMDRTYVGGSRVGPVPPSARRDLEQSETALDLDIRVVGRSLRQAVNVVPEVNSKLTANGEVARLEGVSLTEGEGRARDVLLDNVRLGLKPGELVALVGPSGSGKTELLQIMAALRPADRGQVTIMGRQLPTVESSGGQSPNLEAERELSRWRLRTVGYLPGQPDLSQKQSGLEHVMWVLEQAGFGRDPRDRLEKAMEQLVLVGMTEIEVTRLRPADLNRTERKQVSLARALALDPPLLLVDEPTGGVHSASADKIFRILKSLAAQGQTVFMVTSDPLWARDADRQIEILDGTIVGSLS